MNFVLNTATLLRLTAALTFLCPAVLSLKVLYYTLPPEEEKACCEPCNTVQKPLSPLIKLVSPPFSSTGHHTKWYVSFNREQKTWIEASVSCAADGGRLAFPQTMEEFKSLNYSIKEKQREKATPLNYMHAGFFKKGDKIWKTISGGPVKNYNFMEWQPGQPGNEYGEEFCGAIDFSGKMYDVSCNIIQLHYICDIRF